MSESHSWSRSRYPLQSMTTKEIMEQSQPQKSTLSSEEAHRAALSQLLKRLDATNAIPVPWYQAVTEDRESQRSSTPQLDHGIDEDRNYEGSSTAVSVSQRSSFSPVKRETQLSEKAVSPPPIPQSDNNQFETISNVSSSWTRPPYPTQVVPDGSIGSSPIRTPPPQTHNLEESFEPTPNSDDGSIHRTRTLRRTPWNRRIHSPTASPVQTKETYSPSTAQSVTSYTHSVTAPSETSVPGAFPEDDDDDIAMEPAQNATKSEVKYWERDVYPLQSNLVGFPTRALSPPTPAKEPWLVRRGLSDDVGSAIPSSQYSEYPHSRPAEHTNNIPKPTASLEYQPKVEETPVDVSKTSQTYPLQVPVNNVRQSPTPPPSPLEEKPVQRSTVAAEEPQPKKSAVMFRRSVYPLQSPASISNLRASPSPPASPERKSTPANKVTTEAPATEQTSSPAKSVKRQRYPLQSPASNANFRQPSENSSDETKKDTTTPTLHHPQPQRVVNKSLRRNVYPLQSPASSSDLRNPSPPMTYPDEKPIVKDVPTYDIQDEKPTPSFRRRGYPLQTKEVIVKSQPKPQALPPLAPMPPIALEPLQDTSSKSNEVSQQASGDLLQTYPRQVTTGFLTPRLGPSTAETQQSEQKRDSSSDLIVQHATEPNKQVTEQKAKNSSYPLQSPLNAPSQNSPVPTITIDEPNKKDQNSEKQRRESELASKVVQQWRRQVYPTQSAKTSSPFQRPVTPQPPETQEEKQRKNRPIHLPKNVTAIEDSDQPARGGRTIVVCLDGTGDKFDNDNSNIVHIVSALKKDDPNQITYYQAGIGTYGDGGLSGGISAALDMAVGSGLGLHVRDAYHFLMHTYQEGDRICIFGFSRGAYTARCLGGMIHKVGLLPARNIQQIPFAYEFYANDTEEGWKQSSDFKKTFCIDVNVHFIGCFDSVASVGFIPRQLPLASTPTNKPRYFRHAMALDERRAKFKICRYSVKTWEEILAKNPEAEEEADKSHHLSFGHHSISRHKNQHDMPPASLIQSEHKNHHGNLSDEEYERLSGHDLAFDTDASEVWFAGAHADIGGGAVPNDERHKLAQIPLRWMIRQAFECNTGILFKTKILAEYGLDVHTLWPKYHRLKVPSHGPPPSYLEKYSENLPPRELRREKLVPIMGEEKGEPMYQLKNHTDEDWTPEQVEDFYDAMAPLNDQLIQAPSWWILEAWPVQYKVPLAPGEVAIRTGMNLGRYRGVEDAEPHLHWTVQQRVEQMSYRIGIRTAPHAVWKYVV